MHLDRRQFVAIASLASPVVSTRPAQAGPSTAALAAIDAREFEARPGSPDDQTRVLQRAIDEATRARSPLVLAPGIYRAGDCPPALTSLARAVQQALFWRKASRSFRQRWRTTSR
jgi:hypothetical protein